MAISQHTRAGTNKLAGPMIAAGAIAFSGSIFLLFLKPTTFGFLGTVTPVGGMSLIFGYALLAL
jgi:uncharacterized membrane protein YgdD (TMEM256/DUF423 family)